jgi:Arm DNA-binding domain
MAQKIHRLSARGVETLATDGRHADGGGLYLSISKNGGRRWVFLYRRQGRLREMGLGSARDVPLIKARERSAAARLLLSEGKDPLAERPSPQKALTFSECSNKYIDAHRAGWRNAKHAAQWSTTLATYADPVVGKLPVSDVDITHVMRILEPIWATKTETAGQIDQFGTAFTERWVYQDAALKQENGGMPCRRKLRNTTRRQRNISPMPPATTGKPPSITRPEVMRRRHTTPIQREPISFTAEVTLKRP